METTEFECSADSGVKKSDLNQCENQNRTLGSW